MDSDLVPNTTPATSVPDITTPINQTMIGYILSNGVSRQDTYKCHDLSCSQVTFKRLQDLKRHNNSRHNRHGARFWCPVDGCERSMKSGGRAFPRKDKMVDHLEKKHADKVGFGMEADTDGHAE
jgi:hypothetical protein